MSLSTLLVRSHFPPDTLVADLYDHLGFAISFGVAMRSCICPVPSSITQPISAALFGSPSHTLISIVATELVSTLTLRAFALLPRILDPAEAAELAFHHAPVTSTSQCRHRHCTTPCFSLLSHPFA
ncbi:hypothetical protein M436DRAFT_79342 [Aureobasidium namibiae CBS 147.97]|uniref:Uncharacterized protein n=1 Tax=Aureobasidium namibiae CBS 147.97 TaxID=1043004 RepID=A0A074XND7_9PEZI